MNALGEILEPLTTKIMFVSANNPGGGGGTVPQTGDIIGMILAIIAVVTICAAGAYFAYSKYRSSAKQANGTLVANKGLGIALSIVAIMSLIGVLFCYTPLGNAFAQDKLQSEETIYAYVDETNGNITFDENYIYNNSGKDIIVSSSEVTMTEEIASIPGVDQMKLTIAGIDSVLFEGTLAKPDEQRDPYVPDMKNTIKNGEKGSLYYAIDNCGKITASALIGKTAFFTSLTEENCYSVTYNAGEAVEGQAPSVQILRESSTITVSDYGNLVRWGYHPVG